LPFFQHKIRKINVDDDAWLMAGEVYDARLCVYNFSGSFVMGQSTLRGVITSK